MPLLLLTFLLFIAPVSSFCEDNISLSFKDLLAHDGKAISEKYNQKRVLIKGFIYQDAHGNFYLSNDAGLKSCCLGKKFKEKIQILVTGLKHESISFQSGKLTTLSGLFIEQDKNYVLKQALIIEDEARSNASIFLAVLLFPLLFLIYQLIFKNLRARS